MKLIYYLFIFFFSIFMNFFSFQWNSYEIRMNSVSAQTELEKRMEILYKEQKNFLDEYFWSKEAFEEHYKKNYNWAIDDVKSNAYMFNLRKNKAENDKKINESNTSSWSDNSKSESESKFNVNDFVWVWDDDFVLNMLFWTSDKAVLEKSWFLPNQSSDFYQFMLNIYWWLFTFFVIVWSIIIIYFIFFIIQNWWKVFWKNKDRVKFWKFEDYFIAFIIVIVILYWWIRLYMLILQSWMKSIEDDLNSIWVETTNIEIINKELYDITWLWK